MRVLHGWPPLSSSTALLVILTLCSWRPAASLADASIVNPIMRGADPYVMRLDDVYYVMVTRQFDIAIYPVTSLEDLETTDPERVWYVVPTDFSLHLKMWVTHGDGSPLAARCSSVQPGSDFAPARSRCFVTSRSHQTRRVRSCRCINKQIVTGALDFQREMRRFPLALLSASRCFEGAGTLPATWHIPAGIPDPEAPLLTGSSHAFEMGLHAQAF